MKLSPLPDDVAAFVQAEAEKIGTPVEAMAWALLVLVARTIITGKLPEVEAAA